MADARRLVELSGLLDPNLKKATADKIRKNGITRPVQKLVALLGHPCSQEQIEKVNSGYSKKYQSYQSQGVLDEIGLVKPNKEELLESMAHNAAQIIGEGFDVAFKDNLNVNSVTGEITVKRDAAGQPDSRFLKCAAAEVNPETPGQKGDPSSSAFGFFDKTYGKGKTRKQKKRSKKTLRRRKVKSTKT